VLQRSTTSAGHAKHQGHSLKRTRDKGKGKGLIALIDYGAGNLTSVRKGLTAAGASFVTPARPEELSAADGIVVPGVGHFGATATLDDGWRTAIVGALERGVPLLGICLGMQWFFEGSAEAPRVSGIGALSGHCFRLPPVVKVPHVGWNSLDVLGDSRILRSIPNGTQVYFTHSYAAPLTPDCVATTAHGEVFAAAVERRNLFGVQFHPEKSGAVGLRVLANFVELVHAV
jgi:imidazole glycerol-phosphate synthase subunit HisH